MNQHTSSVPILDPQTLIGTWRRFGSTGPVYEIIAAGAVGDDPVMRIRVVETGEEVDYRLADILDDPREH